MNSVVSIILFKLSHHRLYNKSATISFPMAFSPQEQLLFCPVSYFWIFKVEENAKLKKKTEKITKTPFQGLILGNALKQKP